MKRRERHVSNADRSPRTSWRHMVRRAWAGSNRVSWCVVSLIASIASAAPHGWKSRIRAGASADNDSGNNPSYSADRQSKEADGRKGAKRTDYGSAHRCGSSHPSERITTQDFRGLSQDGEIHGSSSDLASRVARLDCVLAAQVARRPDHAPAAALAAIHPASLRAASSRCRMASKPIGPIGDRDLF